MSLSQSSPIQEIRNSLDRGIFNDELDKACVQLFEKDPCNLDVLMQYGRLRYLQKRYAEAAEIFNKGHSLKPGDSDFRTMLFTSYKDNGNYTEMLKIADSFQSSSNTSEMALAYTAYLDVCDWPAAKKMEDMVFRASIAGEVDIKFLPALMMLSNGLSDISPQSQYQLHQQWARQLPREKDRQFPKKTPGRIRIAYVSGDFYRHPVGFFMLQIIAAHNRKDFEVFCYSQLHQKPDDLTALFEQNADHFIDITHMDDTMLAEQMEADAIHIAVDLSGHTFDSRTAAFAQRMAPVQISYLGYPNTTALPAMDFHITDHYAQDIKHGTLYSEKLLFMPKSFLCYGVEWSEDKKETTPCEETGIITFDSFNNSRKMNLEVINTWADILKRVTNSRFILKFNGSGNTLIQQNIQHLFAEHGIDKERIILLDRTATVSEHILAYHHIDIALDTFPYTGTTTTCEALSQGVPVVTLVGPKHANRVSYSILKNIGYEESIAYSQQEYVEKAVNLANNPQGLSILRRCLSTLLQYSPLRQTENFISDLEGLYKQAWEIKTGSPAITGVQSLPGSKVTRTTMFVDQLTPDIWHAFHAFINNPDTSTCLIVAISSSANQDAINGYLNMLAHFDLPSTHKEFGIVLQPVQMKRAAFIRSLLKVSHYLYLPGEAKKEHRPEVNIAKNLGRKIIISGHGTNYTPAPLPPLQDMKVTVCIPTYNRAELLTRAVESVLQQGYQNFEISISDNASTDNTEALCRQWAKSDGRIRYHRNECNLGGAANIMQVYERADTELVVMCADDDFLYPEHLEKTVKAFHKNPGIGIAFGQTHIGETSDTVSAVIPSMYTKDCLVNPQQLLLESISGNNICWTAATIRKAAITRAQEYAKEHWNMDAQHSFIGEGDYFLGLLLAITSPLYYIHTPAAFYRIDNDTYSSNQLGGNWSTEIRLRTVAFLDDIYKHHYGIDRAEQCRVRAMVKTFKQSIADMETQLSPQDRITYKGKLAEFTVILDGISTHCLPASIISKPRAQPS